MTAFAVRRRLQCVNWLHASLSLSLSLSLSFTHSFALSYTPFSLALSLFRSFACSLECLFSFHSRDNFPHPPFFGKETRQNVIVYVIWILQHFTCPGFSDIAVCNSKIQQKKMTDADSGFVGDVRRNEDLSSEINKQLARRKVTFRNKFTLDVLWHLLTSQNPLSLFFLIPFSNHFHIRA